MREKILGLKNETPNEEELKFENIPFIDNYLDFKNIFTDYIINKRFKLDNIKRIKIIFKYKIYFHQLLEELEKTIHIVFNDQNINLCFLIYLCLLIKEKEYYINYYYKWEDILKINNLKSIYKDNITKIFIAKIINYLIYNYKGFNDFDENIYKNNLLKIENENNEIIKNNIKYLNYLKLDWNEKDINKKNFDEILIEIYIALIKQNLLGNNEYIDLFANLDYELIDLTETFIEKLFGIENEINLNNYIITKEDLFNEKKIYFYYYLFKYVLKESQYFYKFSFFLTSKKTILKIVKENPTKLFLSDLDKSIKIKYDYVLKRFLDNKYYETKYLNEIHVKTKIKNNQLTIKNNKKEKPNENENRSNDFEIISLKEKKNNVDFGILIINKSNYPNLPDINYINQKKISEKIMAFVSNSIYPNGKDIITFYNIMTNEVEKNIEGYSFKKELRSLDIIDIKRKKYLICTIGIISSKQKNGVILIDLEILENNIKKKDEEYIKFFKTDFFVESVCHIINTNSNSERINNSNITNSNSILVCPIQFILLGGLDEEKREGTVKLFKLMIEDNLKLEFLQDIIMSNPQYQFSGSVYYIKQEDNGEVQLGFKNIKYICKKPNLDYYLNNE